MSETHPFKNDDTASTFFKVIATSELFQGGRVLIPKKVRDLLHLKDDGTVIWIQYGDKIIIDTAVRDQFFKPVWREWEKKKKEG